MKRMERRTSPPPERKTWKGRLNENRVGNEVVAIVKLAGFPAQRVAERKGDSEFFNAFWADEKVWLEVGRKRCVVGGSVAQEVLRWPWFITVFDAANAIISILKELES